MVVEQWIAAPSPTVYEFLTESEKWSSWQGESAEIDARPRWDPLDGDGQRHECQSQFVELVPNEKVVFTWGWIEQPGIPSGSTTVQIGLREEDGGTLVVLTHRDIPPEEAPLQRMGWAHYLPRLAAAAEGKNPGTDTGPGG